MTPKELYRQWSKIVRRTEDGEPCLPWDRLPDRIRAAWIAITPPPEAPAEPGPAPVTPTPDPPMDPPKRKPRKRA